MAEESFQEKTEEASPRKLEQAREDGNVAKSAEFNSVFILLFGVMSLSFIATRMFEHLRYGFKLFYQEVGNLTLTIATVSHFAAIGIKTILTLVGPFALVIMIVGLAVNIWQVGFLFTLKPLAPKLSKINPIAGFGKFFKLKSFVELVKGLIKLVIVGNIAYFTLMSYQHDYLRLMNATVVEIIGFICTVMFQVAVRVLAALMILAILDLYYQRWQYRKDMRMSKVEVKDEQKQSEGDPQVKSHIRSMQMARARDRMMQKVPEADVVITNPTQLAIALKYDPAEMEAPIVLAKGARLIAQRIKETAIACNIPIYENKPLARSLYKMCDTGKAIPVELFQAVAEVFAYVYKLRNRQV